MLCQPTIYIEPSDLVHMFENDSSSVNSSHYFLITITSYQPITGTSFILHKSLGNVKMWSAAYQCFSHCWVCFIGFVQQALWLPSQDPSEWRTWRCQLTEDPSSESEAHNSIKLWHEFLKTYFCWLINVHCLSHVHICVFILGLHVVVHS